MSKPKYENIYIFIIHSKFLIVGYITRACWFWSPNSVFGLWRPLVRLFDHQKNIFSIFYRKFSDQWILILKPKFYFWALRAILQPFDPQKYNFFHLYKISKRLTGHLTYIIFEPPNAQSKNPADSEFNIKLQIFRRFWIFLGFFAGYLMFF
jgi:hypothetical protein